MIRYEDLTRDPEAVLRKVCAFVGEEFDPAMLDESARAAAGTVTDLARPWQADVATPVTMERQGKWKLRLGPADKARVAAVVHRELPALGYEPSHRRHVIPGVVLNQFGRVSDVSLELDRRRFARRFQKEGPDVLKERLDEFIGTQMSRVGGPHPPA